MSQWDGKWWYNQTDDNRWLNYHDENPLVIPIPAIWQAGRPFIVKNREYALSVISKVFLNKGYVVPEAAIIYYTSVDIDVASDRPMLEIHAWTNLSDARGYPIGGASADIRGYVDIPDRIIAFVSRHLRPESSWRRIDQPPQEQLIIPPQPPPIPPPIPGRELRAITLR